MDRISQQLKIDSDLLGCLSTSMNEAANTIDWLMAEYKNQEPLKESYIKLATLCLDLLYEANKPNLYNDVCDEIREHRFVLARNGHGKHSVAPLFDVQLEEKK